MKVKGNAMIRVLVVEDERLEREAIQKLIYENFHKNVMTVVSTNNGEQGLQEFKKQSFDLVITDINVPKLSGLKMIKEIKFLIKATKTIILTGYDYFEYAQEAIQIGVDDFILKPATQKELCERIAKVIQLIDVDSSDSNYATSIKFKEMQSILQSDLIYAILYNDSATHIARYFPIFLMDVTSAQCFCIKRDTISTQRLEEIINRLRKSQYHCFFETYFEFAVIFLFYEIDSSYKNAITINEVFGQLHTEDIMLGIGNVKTSIEDFHQSFLEALHNLQEHCKPMNYLQHMQTSNGLSISAMNENVEEIIDGIQKHQLSISSVIAAKLYEEMALLSHVELKEALHLFLELLNGKLKENEIVQVSCESITEHILELKQMDRAVDVRSYITYLLKSVIDSLIYNKRKKSNKLIVNSYDYIEKNYHRPIGLNDLASYLEVTPQYISSLLTQHTQNNFTNILAEVRIEKAKHLLRKNKKIKEVAVLVGFLNQNYFAKTFKKVTGLTPREFKSEE